MPAAATTSWRGARRILAVRLDNIGDVVLLGPALRELHRALPAARISLLASPAGAQAAGLLPWVDEVLAWRASWQDISSAGAVDPERELALVADLRARQFDAAFVFTSFSQSPWPPAYACALAGIPYRAGQAKDFGGALLTVCVAPPPDDGHQADRNLHLLDAVGVPVTDRSLEIRVPAGTRAAAAELLAGFGILDGAPFVVAAPGASCATRRYPPARFAEVVAGLRGGGHRVVVVGSERERDLLEPVAATADASLVGRTSLAELAAVVERAELVVCNNSGPLHLADATRRPVVLLDSGAEAPTQWPPRSVPYRALQRPTACSPCHRFDCPTSLECLDIPPGEVVAACNDLLAQNLNVIPTGIR